ncbi:glycosyltransferase family 2 protein [Tamlana sp. I1]|uniref:glycosyltransferase family 2 protein n=1 Tax=Tamlana sp. I1 TaxID=2762061 RepID=UPI00188FBE1E|nr:glycosyltransferase family A protein [Tamlana sp. I1]
MQLSIIIPIYNAEKQIKNCVESIINQNFKEGNFEIILVNDGSTDQSEKICLNLEKEILGIRYFTKENAGPGHTRNYGLSYAKGEYIWFIDADDYLVPNVGKTLVKELESQLDMYVFGYQSVTENGDIISKTTYLNEVLSPIQSLEKKYYTNTIWCKLIKKSILKDNNITFREDVRGPEDFHFSLRLLSVIKKLKTLDIICYNYLENPTSLMNSRSEIHLQNLANASVIVANDLKQFISNIDEDEKKVAFSNWLNHFLYGLMFSLFRFNYSTEFIIEIINTLKSNHNYPISTNNLKGKKKLFTNVANNKLAFLQACRVKRLVK